MILPFTGFGPGALAWFRGLARDNSKDYFQRTRATFESDVRGPMEAMMGELSRQFRGDLKMFRQNRDVRFSADKSPYKLNTYGVIWREGNTGLYASISAKGLYAGTGLHELAPDQLARYREALLDDREGPKLVRAVEKVERAGLAIEGDVMKSAPRGVPRDHPRLRMLRHRTVILGAYTGKDLGRGVIKEVAAIWKKAAPVTDWLVEHVGQSELPADARPGRRGVRPAR